MININLFMGYTFLIIAIYLMLNFIINHSAGHPAKDGMQVLNLSAAGLLIIWAVLIMLGWIDLSWLDCSTCGSISGFHVGESLITTKAAQLTWQANFVLDYGVGLIIVYFRLITVAAYCVAFVELLKRIFRVMGYE